MKNIIATKPSILLVDDEPNILSSYSRGLRKNWNLITASSGEEGLAAIREHGSFAVIVSDYNMPRMNGISFLTQALELAPESVRMMLTGEGDFHIATRAVNEGNIFRFLTKPCSLENLEKSLVAGYQQFRLLQIEKEARRQELQIAGEIQQTLLLQPVPTGLQGVEIASTSVASQGVDGDFIDFFRLSDSCFDLVVGDVMGKGVHAALVGAAARNQLARIMWKLSRSSEVDPAPETVIQALAESLEDQLTRLAKFITMTYARFDTQAKRMTFVDSGHMPTLWYKKEQNEWVPLKGRNFPIGLPVFRPIEENSVDYLAGDKFLFYSDGLFEGRNQQKKMYGDCRLMDILGDLQAQSADDQLKLIIDDFKTFVGSDKFDDDLTIVLVQIG